MKIRILDRVLVALAGLLILALCAALAAQLFFDVDVIGTVTKVLKDDSTRVRAFLIAGGAVLLLLGLYCFLVLFRHRRRRDKFVMQKTESGELAISVKALDSMVQKCLEQHPEINAQSVRLNSERDGLLIRIRGTLAGGISIPLTVDTLQKQIRQYVTACSGVEVKDIKVQIEGTGEDAKDAAFAIEAPAATPLLRGSVGKNEEKKAEEEPDEPEEEKKAEPEKPAAEEKKETPPPVSEISAAAAAAEMILNEAGDETEDDRPIHQRLFSTPEEPCVMPMPPLPPENTEKAEETETPAAEEPAEEKTDGGKDAEETEEKAPEKDAEA